MTEAAVEPDPPPVPEDPAGDVVLDYCAAVRGILQLGGTILGTSRTNPLKEKDGIAKVIALLRGNGIFAPLPASTLEQLADISGVVGVKQGDLSPTAIDQIANRIGGRDVSVTFTGRNLMLWTKYQGVDPEVSYLGAGGSSGIDENFVESIDAFGFPLPRRFGLSVKIGY